MESFLDGTFDVEREAGINFRRDFTRDNVQDLFAKFDEKSVKRRVDLLVHRITL